MSGGVLSSDVAKQTGCGSTTSPWLIKALPGQRINLTLLDFGAVQNEESPLDSSGQRSMDHCQVYGIIRETLNGKASAICGGIIRERNVYVSEGNELEVRIMTSPAEQGAQFLIKYQSKSASMDRVEL